MHEEEFDIGIINNINYIYNCAKDWFNLLVWYDEKAKENETCIDPETEFQAGIPGYIDTQPSSPGSSHGDLTQNSYGQITPDQSPAQTRIQIVPGSETRRPLTEAELKDALAKTTRILPTLLEHDSSDEETPDEKWAKDVISRASATNYSESYSQSIAQLSNALSDMDTTALSAALNAANVDISDFIQNGKSTKACQIIARIMFDEQFGSARDIVARGKGNEQQMREIWGNDITNRAKRVGSLCYLCTGRLVAGGQAEMEHRMKCGEFYGIFAYIYSLYPKELAEWRYYVNKVADTKFKGKLEDYYDAVNMDPIDEDKLNGMYNNIIRQFKRDTGITDAKFTNLLRAYLHEFAYAHHVCNQIKCDHDLDVLNKNREWNVDNYYNVVRQHLDGVQPRDYKPSWKHMQINPEFSKAESPQIRSGLKKNTTNLYQLKGRIVNQMKLLRKFSREIATESGQTQERMILRILRDALINMNDKKGTTDPSKRIIEQANLLAQGANFYNNDITDAFEFNNDFRPPAETQRDDNWSEKLFKNRLPRFLERIDIILDNTYTYEGVPNTLKIIDKCLTSPRVSDITRNRILYKLNGYIRVLTEINNKVETIILNYQVLPDRDDWTGVKEYLRGYLRALNTLSKVERRKTGALILLERDELNPQKVNQSSVSTGRAQSSTAATFASKAKIPTGNKTPSGVEAIFRPQPVARRGTDNARNTTGVKITRPVSNVKISKVERQNAEREAILREIAIRLANAEREAEQRSLANAEREAEQRRRSAIRKREVRAAKNAAGVRNTNKRVKLNGGRKRQIGTMRKLKRRPRKTTQRVGRRKRTMKRKPRSRKNTRRR